MATTWFVSLILFHAQLLIGSSYTVLPVSSMAASRLEHSSDDFRPVSTSNVGTYSTPFDASSPSLKEFHGPDQDPSPTQDTHSTTSDNPDSPLGKSFESHVLVLRPKRMSIQYRARCCYVDVMCSRGCRRPITSKTLKKRSADDNNNNNDNDDDDSEMILNLFGGLDSNTETDPSSQQLSTPMTPSAPHWLTSLLQAVKDQRDTDSSRRNSDVTIRTDDGDDHSTRFPSSFSSLTARQPVHQSRHDVIQSLPTVLDSLEYLMKGDDSR